MAKLTEVKLKIKEIKDYEKFNTKDYEKLISVLKKIKGKTIIHISATAAGGGGGVAEILKSQIPLEISLGLQSHWLIIEASEKFFKITKKIHNLLQGSNDKLTKEEEDFYLKKGQELGKTFEKFLRKFKTGTIIIHDPQPLTIINFIPNNFKTILRIHPDLSTPNKKTLNFLEPFIGKYQTIILSSKDYKKNLWVKKIKIITPSIDPLSPKNIPMCLSEADKIISSFGLNCSNPIIAQVSRFDKWKDPMGVLKAYRLAKKKIPNIQLVLSGFFLAKDDPEAPTIYKKIQKYDKDDKDSFIFSNPKILKNISNEIFINALYTASDIIIQKSIREGFGLTVTEAMWKGKPVIAGKTSGTSLQISNNKNGILINTPKEASEAIIKLLKNKGLRKKLGKSAQISVKNKFLILKFLLKNIKAY